MASPSDLGDPHAYSRILWKIGRANVWTLSKSYANNTDHFCLGWHLSASSMTRELSYNGYPKHKNTLTVFYRNYTRRYRLWHLLNGHTNLISHVYSHAWVAHALGSLPFPSFHSQPRRIRLTYIRCTHLASNKEEKRSSCCLLGFFFPGTIDITHETTASPVHYLGPKCAAL